MTHTIKIEVYNFSELNEKAKEKALNDHCKLFEPICSDEFGETCKAIEKVFPITIGDLSEYSCQNRYSIHELNDGEEYQTKDEYLANAKYKDPEYTLTGMYSDLYFLQALPSTGKLKKEDFEDALYTLFKAYTRALEEEQSFEYISELADSNEWYFLKNGEIAPNSTNQ